jgi:YebC/PmpR family DNA-binding regulatory protein
MAGHSKWANIQHRKGRQDEKRGAAFSRVAKEITVAARMGGGDTAFNPRLRLASDKAKGQNMPKDKIENAIKKGTGELEGVEYVEIRYEGYGVGGAAVSVDCLTDNKTRTVADVRHAFSKQGGNMGADGCVAFLFKHCGQMIFAPGVDETALVEAAIEAGAEDVVSSEDGSLEIITAPAEFMTVKDALEAAGFKPEFGEVTMKPETETELSGADAEKMQKLLDALEGLDDVQEIYTTAVMDEQTPDRSGVQ